MGYLFHFRPGLQTIAAFLDECVIPRVIGKDATAVEAIWRDLWTFTMTYGRGGIAGMAMSALDIALWDAVGKRAGLPLHRLWGHYRSKIPIYGSGCFRGAGGDGMIEKALNYVKQGYKAIKMQVAHVHTLAQDLDNVRRMREAVGPDIDIMIDVNMGWSADVAIEMGRKFEQYNIYWLEEPVPADDFAGYQRIAAALDMRVVGGETHFTRYDLRPFFINPCLPILQPDPMRGGMTDLAQDRDARRHLGHHHRAASVPRAERAPARLDPERHLGREHGAARRSLGRSAAEIKDGFITAPERPGHGLRFKEEVFWGRGGRGRGLGPWSFFFFWFVWGFFFGFLGFLGGGGGGGRGRGRERGGGGGGGVGAGGSLPFLFFFFFVFGFFGHFFGAPRLIFFFVKLNKRGGENTTLGGGFGPKGISRGLWRGRNYAGGKLVSQGNWGQLF